MSKAKYRILYDFLFTADRDKEGIPQQILYKGEKYDGDVALDFVFRFFDDAEKEIFFEKNEQPHISVYVCVDLTEGFEVLCDQPNKIKMYPAGATIWQDPSTPVSIPFEDGVEILQRNIRNYFNTNNCPAQNLAFCSITPEEFAEISSKHQEIEIHQSHSLMVNLF